MAQQQWDAALYADAAAFVPALGAGALDLLAPQPGERILDLGCGDGTLTEQLVASGADVVGVDASPEMVRAAAARGLPVQLGDAQDLPFADAGFDAVFSNAVLHWIRDQDAVLRGVRRVLRPGGRFVAEFAGHGNVAAIGTAVAGALAARGLTGRNPWFAPTPAAYAERLERHGFRVLALQHFPRPTPLPRGFSGWLATFGDPLLAPAPAQLRDEVVAHAEQLAAPWLRDEAGAWTADYVRLRVSAVVPTTGDDPAGA
jgi:SAM-dependent methyltransferase